MSEVKARVVTEADIAAKVIAEVATYSMLSAAIVEANRATTLVGLAFDHVAFVRLAGSLRHYVQFFRPEATLRVKEIEKKDLTVAGLIDLVTARILA